MKVLDGDKEQFFISKYKVFEYSSNHYGELWVSKDMNFTDIAKIKLLRHTGFGTKLLSS